ncbi:MAG TPA: FtsX-like permease family protein [Verrucomicrobiae bacterium]|nr:FtsX-like permease family protein [Verrucomicrobiae bacterium]
MKARDLGELAFRNLREAVLRNSLTTLGVAVGVASLVAMLSLGAGLQQMASKRLSGTGLFDTVYVMSRMNLRGFGRAAMEPMPPGQNPRILDQAARQEISRLPHVAEVYPQIRFPTEAGFDGNSFPTIVAGIPVSSRETGAFDGMQGSFFSSPTADEAILQIEFAKALSNHPASLIGKTIDLRYAERQPMPQTPKAGAGQADTADLNGAFSIVPREKSLRIVGIVDTEPAAGFGGIGSGRLLIPQTVAESLRATQANDLRDLIRDSDSPTYSSLTVRADRPSDVAAIEATIKAMGFSTFSLLDATKNLSLFFAVFDLLLAIFGSLALAVATLGIVNTLVMAILERRREIGVLKALGASDRDVKQIFFAEAGVMGLAGGILGVGFGWLIGRVVTIGTNIYLRRQQLPPAHVFYIPSWLVVGAIVFAVVVSLIAGLYPASRAARLNPVEALRYE